MSIFKWTAEPKKIYMWVDVPPELCFIANTAGSTVTLNEYWTPTSVSLETSTDYVNWSTYTFWTPITLTNVWDKVYWRNTSTTTTLSSSSGYYYFSMTWSIAASGDVTYLINKNWTDTLNGNYCFKLLFDACTSLTTPPELPATTLTQYCYSQMFRNCWITKAPSLPATTLQHMCYNEMFKWCSSLEELPALPTTTLATYCYYGMFQNCSKIKISSTQTWEYQTEYRIPTTWTWTAANQSLSYMFSGTWWTYTSTPTINTTYYTSNTVV